jgi:hypothetical protein
VDVAVIRLIERITRTSIEESRRDVESAAQSPLLSGPRAPGFALLSARRLAVTAATRPRVA